MLRQLDYQDKVLKALDDYLDHLKVEKVKADKTAQVIAEQALEIEVPDFAKVTWNKLKTAKTLPASRLGIDYSPRFDGIGRPVPDVVLKVPTGGGKTLMAVQGLSRVFGRYLNRNTGFVLWIVPNEAIYTQTKRTLEDRQHPYRQALDRAAAGKVRILEKTDSLNAHDLENQLCVMLLMLQSANRDNKDTLKMFQDRGDVHGFFPSEGEQQAHRALIESTPNLDAYKDIFPMVKDSLGNALRLIRPVVVLDEGHKAVSELAFKTLYGFNPCFVLELTATPHDVQPKGGKEPKPARYANVLVEVTGKELDREGMIKMPLNLDPRQGTDWKATLNAALDKLNVLDGHAKAFQSNSGRYIRPIMLVQVERTGKDQRDSGHIHADDVKDWLLTAGFDEAEIAIKTAEQNDLSQPENLDLLLPTNRVRVIITKSALQEGWDCPFAYVLCALAASSNLNAMTQLIGRILRQPHAEKTGVEALDECHVITHHTGTGEAVAAIKKGLEQDGLGDLVINVLQSEAGAADKIMRQIQRRDAFRSTEIYLPKVLWVEHGDARELDYETDIMATLDWRGYDPAMIAAKIPENAQQAESQLQRISIVDSKDHFKSEQVEGASEAVRFDPAYAVRMLTDIVPNPFVGREIVGKLIKALEARGFDSAKIGALATLIVEELRKGLDAERAVRAEKAFKDFVSLGRIQFRLRIDGKNWRMPFSIETSEPEGADQLLSKTGTALERSLFQPIYKNELNTPERDVAGYLDAEKALQWWHRNVARTQYGLQGWRKGKIYPDFIFAAKHGDKPSRITVLETKGDHLEGGDTVYKRELLKVMSDCFAWDTTPTAGTLELVQNGETVECALIMFDQIRVELPKHLVASAGK